MSAPESALLPREPEAGAPIFTVPWHAEVLGIANALIRGGMFSAAEWAEALGALERLVGEKSPETGGSLQDRVEAWRRAYLNTPHGQPVTLAAAEVENVDHHHDHDHHHHHHDH